MHTGALDVRVVVGNMSVARGNASERRAGIKGGVLHDQSGRTEANRVTENCHIKAAYQKQSE
jgi:hypothetical protein